MTWEIVTKCTCTLSFLLVSCLVDVGLDRVLPVAVAPHVALGRVRVDKVLHLVPVRPRLLAAPPPPKLPSIALRPFFVPASNDRTEINFWGFRRFLPAAAGLHLTTFFSRTSQPV